MDYHLLMRLIRWGSFWADTLSSYDKWLKLPFTTLLNHKDSTDLTSLLNERERFQLQQYTNEYIRRFQTHPDLDPNAVFFFGRQHQLVFHMELYILCLANISQDLGLDRSNYGILIFKYISICPSVLVSLVCPDSCLIHH